MKKETVVTARITEEMKKAIRSLADKDERTVGWVVRRLLTEALESRGLVNGKGGKAKTR